MNEDFRKCKGTHHYMHFTDSEFKKSNFASLFCPFNALETGKLPGSLVKKNVKLNIVTNHLFNPNKNTSDT